jgi:hypothetical protein
MEYAIDLRNRVLAKRNGDGIFIYTNKSHDFSYRRRDGVGFMPAHLS